MPDTTVSVGDISVNNAGSGDIEVMNNLSGSCVIVKPAHLLAALRGYLAAAKEPTPLAIIGNGEFAQTIGE